jgi:5'-nucleotidase
MPGCFWQNGDTVARLCDLDSMHILLTNDDGIFAPGLVALYRPLTTMGSVSVVAPLEGWSGAGHGITLHEPLTVNQVDVGGLFSGLAVEGSPADCVKLAIKELRDKPFDLVVAGINNGANVGINVYYSGTVAAAIEAAFSRIPSVAVSLAHEPEMNYSAAAKFAIEVIGKLLPLAKGDVVNLNIPPLSLGEPKGIRVVPQGTSGLDEHYVPQASTPGQTAFQLSGAAYREETTPTDTTVLVEGYITVTALSADLTDHHKTSILASRLDGAAIHPPASGNSRRSKRAK